MKKVDPVTETIQKEIENLVNGIIMFPSIIDHMEEPVEFRDSRGRWRVEKDGNEINVFVQPSAGVYRIKNRIVIKSTKDEDNSSTSES